MTSHADVERLPAQMGEAELVALAQGTRPMPERLAAVKELAIRATPGATPVLTALLGNAAAPVELRSAAAMALGSEAKPETLRALQAALRVDDHRIVRRAAESLGRVGGPDALPALRALRPQRDPAAARAVAFARSLIAYRHGLNEEWLKPPSVPVLQIDERRALSLNPAPIGVDVARRIAAMQSRELPALPVAIDGGVSLTCAGNTLALVPHRRAAEAEKTSAVPVILLKRSHSLEYFTVHLYILSHPTGGGRLALFGLRPDGTMTHTGHATVDGGVYHFRVDALNTLYSPPIIVEGRLFADGPRIEMIKAVVAPGKAAEQPRARTPGRAAPPIVPGVTGGASRP
jgi:hypothetical protein